jgi:hypothetical protein
MSFIGGIAQSILTDVVKDFLLKPRTTKKSWGCGCLLLIVFVVGFLLLGILINLTKDESETEGDVWKKAKAGDSLFIRDSYGIDFYKKGKVKLHEWEQREVKYAYEERIDFIEVNHVNDKFFFKNKTSFLGICTGTDSTRGHWLMIKPSESVTHPPKPKDQYDYETRRWENKMYDILHETKLSKEFYVRTSDVVLKNNDSLVK